MFNYRVNPVILQQILSKYFSNSVIEFVPELEGQGFTDRFRIGPWAGPEADISNLFHEMSHFAEREIEKLKKCPFSSWGFYFGKPWSILGKSGFEPSTDQSVMREARVWAYQLSLLRHYDPKNVCVDPVELADVAVYLPAWCHFNPMQIRDEYLKINHLARLIEQMSQNEFTLDSFNEEWKKRIEVIGNHFASNPKPLAVVV